MRRTDPQPYWRCTGPINQPERSARPILLYFIGIALVLFTLALVSVVQAAEAWDTTVVNWTQPTECKVGTVCTIGGYELQSAASSTSTTWTSVVTVAPTLRTYKINSVPPGTKCYRLIASLAGIVGDNSDPSDVKCKTTVAPSVPATPLITIAQTAYKLDSGYVDQYKLSAIGLVPFAAPCKPQEVLGLNVVSRKLLKPDPGKPVPLQVLAKCRAAM